MTSELSRAADIRSFLVDRAPGHPRGLAALASLRFGITRQAVHSHLSKLLRDGLLEGRGRTRSKLYRLALLADLRASIPAAHLDEDTVWSERIAPALSDVPTSVAEICRFGFTELLRNAAEHSGAAEVRIRLRRTAAAVEISVSDPGAGIFCRLDPADPRRAALDLVKGGRSTDPGPRPGRGFSCAARAFDSVAAWSGHHLFRREDRGTREEWTFEDLAGRARGTTVAMRLHPRSRRTLAQVLERASVERGGVVQPRAEIPVHLASRSGEPPTSRATALRLLDRLGSFGQVVLDFSGIEVVGPAFADEVFRVFRRENPQVDLRRSNASPGVERMLRMTERA